MEFILNGVDLTKNGEEETVFQLSVKTDPHINTSTESININTNPPCTADDISILVTLIFFVQVLLFDPNLKSKVEENLSFSVNFCCCFSCYHFRVLI